MYVLTVSVECKNTDGTMRLIAVEVLIGHVIASLRLHALDYIVARKWRPLVESDPSLDLSEVVLGLPATYTGKQKDVLRAAAHLAGFTEVGLPTYFDCGYAAPLSIGRPCQ